MEEGDAYTLGTSVPQGFDFLVLNVLGPGKLNFNFGQYSATWDDAIDSEGKKVSSPINGAFVPFVFDLASEDCASLKLTATGDIVIAQIFFTNLQNEAPASEYPYIDTEKAVMFDHFTRTQVKLDDNYDAAAANPEMAKDNLHYSISYHNSALTSVDNGWLHLGPTESSDYIQVTEKTKYNYSTQSYVVFVMKLGEGADLNNFRFQLNLGGVIYLNQCVAAPGINHFAKTIDLCF